MPGCLSSMSQEAINNSRLRSLVLHRKAENESHLEVCSALSTPFGPQRTKAHRPETSICMPFMRGPRRRGRRQPLCSPKQKERPHSPLLFLFCAYVCGCYSLIQWRQCCTNLLGATSSKARYHHFRHFLPSLQISKLPFSYLSVEECRSPSARCLQHLLSSTHTAPAWACWQRS